MKEAELSVALLNGFGAEETGRKDTEDERRRNRYKANERKKKNPLADQQREEMLARFKKKIQQKANSKGEITAKDVINAVLEERQRSKKLKKGGVEAARIIASQDGENESEDIKPGEVSHLLQAWTS